MHRGALFRRQDGAGGENAQAQKMCQLPGVGFVPGMLEAVVFLDGARVGKLDGMPGLLQAVDQPVPVVGRLDDYTSKLLTPRLQKPDNPRQNL